MNSVDAILRLSRNAPRSSPGTLADMYSLSAGNSWRAVRLRQDWPGLISGLLLNVLPAASAGNELAPSAPAFAEGPPRKWQSVSGFAGGGGMAIGTRAVILGSFTDHGGVSGREDGSRRWLNRAGFIGAWNETPVAQPMNLEIPTEGGTTMLLTGFDADRDPLEFEVVTPPRQGVLEGRPPRLTYVPGEGGAREDEFEFRVRDAFSVSPVTSVHLDLAEPTNHAPEIAGIGELEVTPGEPLTFVVLATDHDQPAQTLSFRLLEAPPGAELESETGRFRWTPPRDSGGGRVTATVRVDDDGTPPRYAVFALSIRVLGPPALGVTRRDEVTLDLAVRGTPRGCYRLEGSADLRSWVTLGTGQLGATGMLVLEEAVDQSVGWRWFRVSSLDCEVRRLPRWDVSLRSSSSATRFALEATPHTCLQLEGSSDFVHWSLVDEVRVDAEGHANFALPTHDAAARFFRLREARCAFP